MTLSHSKKEFLKYKKLQKNFLFFEKINNFKFDPIPKFMEIVNTTNFSFLYESVEKGKDKGRYSFCGYQEIDKILLTNNILSYSRGRSKKKSDLGVKGLNKINEIIKKNKFEKNKSLPPMSSAYFGFIGYENIKRIENISKTKKKSDLKIPDILLFLPKFILILDNQKNIFYIIQHVDFKNNSSLHFEDLKSNIQSLKQEFSKNTKFKKMNFKKKIKVNIKSNISKKNFIKNINIAKKYIKNGDIFQVVPSQRFETKYTGSVLKLYQALRKTNPSPFMYYFNFPRFKIVGSSPEILVRLRNKKITIRPIAGTRPRGKTKKLDNKYAEDLLKDKKEIAEHLMLLDLGRNDIGRVANKSSVKVTSEFEIERYSHVMHIVSNVEGKVSSDKTAFEALMAGFPAGTVSGAPKIRAMQIIDELENTKRGIYAGGIGYITSDGEMDTCIALRTGIISNNTLFVQAGGGVVYDSDPNKEYEETVNKAKALFNAAEIAIAN